MYRFFCTPLRIAEYLSVSRACLSSLVATFSRPFAFFAGLTVLSSLMDQTYQVRNRHRKRRFNDQLICIVSNS